MKKPSIHQLRNVLALAVVGAVLSVAYFAEPAFLKSPRAEAGAGQNASGFAWSENIGWISFNSTSDGSAVSYGVNVDISAKGAGGTGVFSGYAWSENVGWISFYQSDLSICPSGATVAQVNWLTGSVTGWARAIAGNAASGWDGCIKFSGMTNEATPKPYGVTISGSKLSGYAWGSDVVGWIDFAPTVVGVPVGVQIAALPCTQTEVASWGTCQPITQCTAEGTSDVPGVRVGICPSGGTVVGSCTVSQTCAAPSTSTGKPKFWQF